MFRAQALSFFMNLIQLKLSSRRDVLVLSEGSLSRSITYASTQLSVEAEIAINSAAVDDGATVCILLSADPVYCSISKFKYNSTD